MHNSLSKFNKGYVGRMSENRCLNIKGIDDQLSKAIVYNLFEGTTTQLQRIYDNPTNFSLKDNLVNTTTSFITNLSASKKNLYNNYWTTLQNFISEKTKKGSYKYAIYPTSLGLYIKNNFTDLPPVEKRYILAKLTGKDDNVATRIHTINCGAGNNVAVLLVDQPFSKEEHAITINEWKEDYTFQGVKSALKKIQSIVDLYHYEYMHVVDAFGEMAKENKKLLKENQTLKDEILRVSKTTWN